MATHQTSFAFDGVGGQWVWFEEDGRNVVIAEIRRSAQETAHRKGAVAERDFKALIREKLRRAERGALQMPGDGRSNLVSADGVMEIKWSQGRDQWRLYYCQPLQRHADRIMLGLHFSRKIDKDQQNQGIKEAARRWICWQAGQQR